MRFLKFLFTLFIYGVTLAALGAAGGAAYVAYMYEKKGPLEEAALVQIPHGTSVRGVAEILLSEGVFKDKNDAIVFHVSGRISGDAAKLKAGEYEIKAHATMGEVMKQLIDGKTFTRQITIREGLTNWEIEQFLMNEGVLDKEEEILPNPEGAYLPETYSYQKGDSVAGFMQRMNEAMENTILPACGILLEREAGAKFEVFLPQECPNAKEPLKTVHDVLILASIIEKETAVPEERRRVAGVFTNRLRKGIALQTDPTVIYALTKGKPKNDGQGPLGRRLLKKDLDYDSPYNTYLYPGLPPGAIANPGKASIEAALNPEEHNYIYFVADGSGGHAFAKTLNEHNANVAKWRKIRKGQ